ncbi:T9SS type A sorting domain-containing protein [Emticicia sp. W12TSBA100-4]|uniref:T9SS type A sorting domain-containing protein n=1 Tax=Emticicia sp. W12TSBA100-4 TaxID=3160965 RepID=UPI003305CB0C
MKQLSTLLLFIFISIRAFGQQATMPTQCTNPGNGILIGGGFSTNIEYGCTDAQNPDATFRVFNAISPNGDELINPVYIYDLKDGQDITRFPPPQTSMTVSKSGTYWILQAGNYKGQVYIACKAVEVIQPEQPDVKVSSCGDKSVTVTFLNTPKNQKHGKYRILWGDGFQEIISKPSFPFDNTHSYLNPPVAAPAIVAIYTRGNKNEIEVCNSNPYWINSVAKPIINELEGLNGGESVKLTVSSGLDGQEYTIQKKTGKGNWTDTGKKIIRNSGISSATQTIEGLNKDSLYCFRLQLKDDCNSEVLSDEICTMKLNATFLSANETKLEWNIPSANLNRYLISYFSTGEKPNTISTTSTSQILDFLDCKKKYNFQVTTFNGSSLASSQVRVKSPQIIIDPSAIKEYPAPDNISIVSVDDSSRIRFNILEIPVIKRSKYLFYRSVNGNNFEKIAESFSNFYMDKDVDLDKNQYCYAFKYENECGIQSALSLNKSCNIKLSLENTTLKWTPFKLNNNSSNKSEYYVESIEEDFYLAINKTEDTTINVKANIDLILFNKPNLKPKFRVIGGITQNYLFNGNLISFPIQVFSNTVTYNPVLSTSKEADSFKIYPNPSEDFVQLNSTLQLKTVEIVDLQGKVIENQTIENGQISVKHLPKGKYILRLYGNDKKLISSKTIIKM